eukprot:COSAG05_NODE_20224_length_281_cov_1.126374_1_plen_63_part_01
MKVTNHGNRDMLLTVPFCACELASLQCLLRATCGCSCMVDSRLYPAGNVIHGPDTVFTLADHS